MLSNPGLMGLGEDETSSFIHSALIERLLCAPHGTRRPAEAEAHLAPPEGTTRALLGESEANHTDLADYVEAEDGRFLWA